MSESELLEQVKRSQADVESRSCLLQCHETGTYEVALVDISAKPFNPSQQVNALAMSSIYSFPSLIDPHMDLMEVVVHSSDPCGASRSPPLTTSTK